MEDLKEIIATNLVKFRKSAKLTQLELAEKLKYSDKNISKWERGESVPDIVVLKQLADLYNIKVDDFFCTDIKILQEENKEKINNKTKSLNKKQMLILLLSISLVWLTAIVLFCVFINVKVFTKDAWLCFIYAITASCIISVIFTSLWCTNLLNAITVSLLVWSTGLSIFLTIHSPEMWAIFLVCIPIQILDILWFSLRKVNKNLGLNKDEIENRKKLKEENKELKKKRKQEKKLNKKEKLNLNNKEKLKE